MPRPSRGPASDRRPSPGRANTVLSPQRVLAGTCSFIHSADFWQDPMCPGKDGRSTVGRPTAPARKGPPGHTSEEAAAAPTSPTLRARGAPARAQPAQVLPRPELQGIWGSGPQQVLDSSRDSPVPCLTRGPSDPSVPPACLMPTAPLHPLQASLPGSTQCRQPVLPVTEMGASTELTPGPPPRAPCSAWLPTPARGQDLEPAQQRGPGAAPESQPKASCLRPG